jgi:rhombotail lipoprotein
LVTHDATAIRAARTTTPETQMNRRFLAILAAAPLLLGACAAGTSRHSTSVVRYLYPDRTTVADTAGIPVLRLPLRVGIAFVPDAKIDQQNHGFASYNPAEAAGFGESERVLLMKRVTDHFRKQPFIKSVELIPTSYLTSGGGFDNLDQLRQMFDIDVMVLLAYDQVQFTGEGAATLTYWTILGAYVVEGEKNDTRTLMDAVVVDIASRRVLFRAPGTSVIKARSTPVNLDESKLADRRKGFELAAADLTTSLETSLTQFKEKVKEAPPEELQVIRTAEFERRAAASAASGAGSVDLAVALMAMIVALAALSGRRSVRARR